MTIQRWFVLLFFCSAFLAVSNNNYLSAQPNHKISLQIDNALTIKAGNQPLLSYQFKTVYPPAGQDTNYKRSGFIHPLYTPTGQVLTQIQPPDHYHHYGIWNPWTHTVFEKDTVDFWNIKGHSGTVRFAKFTSIDTGVGYAGFTALHEHVVFKKGGTEKIALNKWQTIKVHEPTVPGGAYLVDITSTYSCASSSPLLLLTYRYGGLGWRATDYWDKNNCEVLTSEGYNRSKTDGTKAKWCMAQGSLPGNNFGGLLIMSHPANYNHPEPLRIWDESGNGGRGDLFINFSPTKDRDWLLEPGKTYTLKYRLLVFSNRLSAAIAKEVWLEYSKQ